MRWLLECIFVAVIVVLDHHVGRVHRVVEIFEFECASFERRVGKPFGLQDSVRLNHALLKQSRGQHHRVCEVLLLVRDAQNPSVFIRHLLLSFEIGVFRAVFDAVSELFATLAPVAGNAFILRVVFFLVFVLLVEVFPELASESGLRVLPAAPPHLAGPLRLVRPATPVKVLLLFEFNFAISADPLIFDSAFPLPELLKLLFGRL